MTNPLDDLLEQAKGIVFPYSEEFAEAHTAFAIKMWPTKLRRRDPAYNRWKFRGPAHGEVNGLLLAVVEGQVIGQLGLIPVSLRVGNQIVPAQWACDLMVDTSLRRKGLGSLLLAVGMTRPMITLGSNPSQLADITMSRMGFKPLRGPRSMFFPLDPSQAIQSRLPGGYQCLTPGFAQLLKPVMHQRLKRLRRGKTDIPVNLVHWSKVIGAIQKRDISTLQILHDLSFLEWRCQGLPGFSPELTALLTQNGSYAIFQAAPQTFYIYDWHAVSFMEARALIRELTILVTVQKSQTIMVLANSTDEFAWLKKLGFFASRNPVKVVYYPNEPLQRFDYFHYCHYDSDGNL